MTARTGVHGSDEHERSREGRGARRTSDADETFFERLPQHFERVPAEFRHLVEQQHAVVREADLPRPGKGPAANQGHVGHRMVRRPERPRRHEAGSVLYKPGH